MREPGLQESCIYLYRYAAFRVEDRRGRAYRYAAFRVEDRRGRAYKYAAFRVGDVHHRSWLPLILSCHGNHGGHSRCRE